MGQANFHQISDLVNLKDPRHPRAGRRYLYQNVAYLTSGPRDGALDDWEIRLPRARGRIAPLQGAAIETLAEDARGLHEEWVRAIAELVKASTEAQAHFADAKTPPATTADGAST